MGMVQEMNSLLKAKQEIESQLHTQQMLMQKSPTQWVRSKARMDSIVLREKLNETIERINTLTEKRYLVKKEKEREKKKEDDEAFVKRKRTDMQAFMLEKTKNKQLKKQLLQQIDRKYGSLGNCPDDEPLLIDYRNLIGVVIKEDTSMFTAELEEVMNVANNN